MSLSLLDEILLREKVDPVLTAKGSALTFDQEDTNFVIIHDAIRELSEVEVGGIDAYNAGTEYSLTVPATYVTYNNNTWQFISAIPQTGVTPGSDPTVWRLASQGFFSHRQNSDEILAEGTADEVSATEIRAAVDAISLAALDSLVVHLAGTETVTGDKTFSGDTEFTGDVEFAHFYLNSSSPQLLMKSSGGFHIGREGETEVIRLIIDGGLSYLQGRDLTLCGLLGVTGNTLGIDFDNINITTPSGSTTFVDSVNLSGGIYLNDIDTNATGGTDTLNIGTVNAEVINFGTGSGNTNINIGTSGTNAIVIGNANSTISFVGSVINESVTNHYVSDKLITLNDGGAAASGTGVGFEIEENSSITGYFKTTGGRDGFLLRSPANAADSSFILTATSARSYTFPDDSGTLLLSGGALGTPSSGVLTNCTGTAAGLTAGTVTTNANMTGDVTSVGNATTIIDTYKTYTTKISLSSAEILALNSSPKQLLPAPGSGKTYELLGVLCNMNFISAAYAANTTLQVLYSGAALVVATNSNIINATVDKIGKMALSAISAAGSTQYLENTALNLNVGGGNPTTGDGTLDIYLTYKIITL
jgi:hypothetical protein